MRIISFLTVNNMHYFDTIFTEEMSRYNER